MGKVFPGRQTGMLFAKRTISIVFLVSLLIPTFIGLQPDLFLSFAAAPITYKQFSSQAQRYVNRPVRIIGLTSGLSGVFNLTSWRAVWGELSLPFNFSVDINLLLFHYPYLFFLNGPDPSNYRPSLPVLVNRLEHGIQTPLLIPIVLYANPSKMPDQAAVIAYERTLVLNSTNFYFLEFLRWD